MPFPSLTMTDMIIDLCYSLSKSVDCSALGAAACGGSEPDKEGGGAGRGAGRGASVSRVGQYDLERAATWARIGGRSHTKLAQAVHSSIA